MADQINIGASEAQHSSSKTDENTLKNTETDYHATPFVPDRNEQSSENNESIVRNDGENSEKKQKQAPVKLDVENEREASLLHGIVQKVLGVSENMPELRRKIDDSGYQFEVERLVRKERNNLDIRRIQAMLHLSFTDSRVGVLEEEVQRLKNDIGGLPSGFKILKPPEHPVYRHELKRSTLQEFEPKHHFPILIPTYQQPAIEVLVDQIPSKDPATSVTTDVSAIHYTPKRLRIRPRRLATHVQQITGQALSTSRFIPYGESESSYPPLVILRPFKILVVFEEAIRASVRDLESKLQIKDQTESGNKEASHVKEGAQDSSNMVDAEYSDSHLLADLKLLIEFLDVDLKSTFDLRTRIRDGTAKSIEFPDLWHLFELGEEVISQSTRKTIYRAINFTGGRDILISQIDNERKLRRLDGFTVDCYSLIFSGTEFGPELRSFSIRKYHGSKAINSLAVYPLKFDISLRTIKESLLSRGARYLALTSLPYAHKMFVGTTLDEPAEEIEGQIIIDQTLAISRNPGWHRELVFDEIMLTVADPRETQMAPFCTHPKYNEGCCGSDVIQKDLELDKEQMVEYIDKSSSSLKPFSAKDFPEKDKILLPHWVYGFVLRSRQWVTLDIDDLSDVKYTNNFDGLVLPPGHKETVRALVQNHAKPVMPDSGATSNLGAAMDLIRGKGKGLIILLHGEPGVGKTSTAECVADLTQRPLFPITCGDIGETASEVETNLELNFQLAHKWGCVLILDEADVFLAKRNKTDLRRNAVVSVFLRTLEYYSGVLFLTTNRVGGIDPAFKSRIHISLFYPRLDLEPTLKLYELLIDRTLKEQSKSHTTDFKIKSKEIMKFAKSNFKRMTREGLANWNGRQIRNAFQTAITLAEYDARQPGAEAVTLGKSQFKTVAAASKEFDEYMKETLGDIDAELARREQTRHDRFGENGRSARSEKSTNAVYHRTGRSLKDSESDIEDSSDTSEDSEDDKKLDAEPEEEQQESDKKKQSNKSQPGPPKMGTSKAAIETEEEEFEQWRKFQEMRKKQKGKA